VPIGEWVLRTACAQLKAWHAAGHTGLSVAINLSARQFQEHDVGQMVRRVLGDCELSGEFLELELTESALMLDPELVLRTLRELKSFGVRLALDDRDGVFARREDDCRGGRNRAALALHGRPSMRQHSGLLLQPTVAVDAMSALLAEDRRLPAWSRAEPDAVERPALELVE